jgi:hypothetical protein
VNKLLLNVLAQRKCPVCLLAILACKNLVLKADSRVDICIVQTLFRQLALFELFKAYFTQRLALLFGAVVFIGYKVLEGLCHYLHFRHIPFRS